MKAMILAAGKGTRLYPLTETMPKPMVPVAGKPVLEHTLNWLRRHGILHIAINVHYQSTAIRDYFNDGTGLGVSLHYSQEPELLGTAGGVKQMEPFFGESFVVAYGDVLTDLDLGALIAFHHAHGPAPHTTLTLDQRPDAEQCGVVALDDNQRVTRFLEKPKKEEIQSPWVNSGIMVLDRALLARIPAGRFSDFGRDILPQWLSENVPIFGWGLPESAYLIDMGTPDKYAMAIRDWPSRLHNIKEAS
ncbi:MAG: nucleotidyltransferase family protein [bacterium]